MLVIKPRAHTAWLYNSTIKANCSVLWHLSLEGQCIVSFISRFGERNNKNDSNKSWCLWSPFFVPQALK